MNVGLHIPDDVAAQIRQSTGPDIARHILEEYAIRAYQEQTLGESQLRRLLGFDTRDEFEDFLAAHHVYRNYPYSATYELSPVLERFTLLGSLS